MIAPQNRGTKWGKQAHTPPGRENTCKSQQKQIYIYFFFQADLQILFFLLHLAVSENLLTKGTKSNSFISDSWGFEGVY